MTGRQFTAAALALTVAVSLFLPLSASGGTEERRMEEILKRPEFNRWRDREEYRVGDGHEALERAQSLTERIAEFLRDLLGFGRRKGEGIGIGGGASASSSVGWIKFLGIAIGAAALGVVIVVLIRKMRSGGAKGAFPTIEKAAIASALDKGDALLMDGSGWFGVADGYAARGEYRLALRATYLSLLATLHDQRKIQFRKNRTNWIYVRNFRGPEPERSGFAALTGIFDRVWYGNEATTADTLAEVRSRLRVIAGATS